MTEQDRVKNQLKDQLKKVNFRLEILDMIEDRLLKIKKLAQRVVEEELTEKEINKRVQELGEQVKLLDSEATQLS